MRPMRLTAPTIELLILAVVCLPANVGACDELQSAKDQDVIARAEKRAEELLIILRAGQWNKAAPLVVTATGKHDQDTRRRMEIPKDATAEAIGEQVGAWFQRLYGTVRPGPIQSVRVLGPDQDFATVYYRHEDLDAFSMRLVDGQWYYTLGFEKPPSLSKAEVRRRAKEHRDQWIARKKPAEADLLQRGVIEAVEWTNAGWHVTFVTQTGHDQPEGRHDYFLHIYLAGDGNLLKVVRGPDRLS